MKTRYTQAECDEANTLRDYEAAHKVWMQTSIFASESTRYAVNEALASARHKYVSAVKAAHPNWIVF